MYVGTQITDEEWQQFQKAATVLAPKVVHSEDDCKLYAAIVVRNAVSDVIDQWLSSGPYKTTGNKKTGWLVYFCEEGKDPRLVDDENPNKPHDQSYATKKAKRLNRDWHKK